jgi:Transglutaminase-like superfamily
MELTVPKRFLGNTLAVGRLAPTFLALGVLRRLVPIDRLARWAWRTPRRERDGAAREHQLVSRVVRACGLAGAPDRDCLQRSLLLYRELSRAGADPVLVMGFRRADGRLEGHAWVVSDGRPLVESDARLRGFVPALRFGRGGRLIGPATAGHPV